MASKERTHTCTRCSFTNGVQRTLPWERLQEFAAPGDGKLNAVLDRLELAAQVLLLKELEEGLLVLWVLGRVNITSFGQVEIMHERKKNREILYHFARKKNYIIFRR